MVYIAVTVVVVTTGSSTMFSLLGDVYPHLSGAQASIGAALWGMVPLFWGAAMFFVVTRARVRLLAGVGPMQSLGMEFASLLSVFPVVAMGPSAFDGIGLGVFVPVAFPLVLMVGLFGLGAKAGREAVRRSEKQDSPGGINS